MNVIVIAIVIVVFSSNRNRNRLPWPRNHPNPNYSRRRFSSTQATGKVFSAEYAIYCKFADTKTRMATSMCRLVVVAVWFADSLTRSTGKNTYTREGWDVQSYPHDIPSDAEEIRIIKTSISVVDYVEEFPQLARYQLSINKVSEFPNLDNVSSTITDLMVTSTWISALPVDWMTTMTKLRHIDISHNRLTSIPDLTVVFPALSSLSAYANAITRVDRTTAVKMYLKENQLTEVPDLSNVKDGFLKLDMKNNKMAAIPDRALPPMPECYYLDFGQNGLTAFPNLDNVTGLTYLSLSSNQLVSVPNLPRMLHLADFSLSDNNLDQFPNLSNVSRSLTHLEIHDNDISTFPDRLVVVLANLESLTIGRRSGDPIHLPGFCSMDIPGTLTVTVHKSDLVCDRNALFAKWRQRTGKLVLKSSDNASPPCHSPPHLSGRRFEEITIEDMLLQEPGRCLDRMSVYVQNRLLV